MSIQSEINRINNNVQTTLNTIAETGVTVGTNSDALPAAAAALANLKADKETGVFYIEGTGSTEGTWLGTHAGITAYYPGLMIAYKVGIAGVSGGTTLNLNGLGAVSVVRNATTAVTTNYAVNSVVFLTYTVDSSGTAYWKTADYDSNSYAYVRQYYTTTNASYPLLMKYDSGTSDTTSYVTKYTRCSNKLYYNPSTGKLTTTGFVGALTGNADTATKLAAAQTIQTNLASTSSASFDGSAGVTPGVTGVLPVANGGTGSSSVDTTPTSGSTKMVTSGGVHTALSGKLATSGGNISGHIYLTGAKESSSTGNTSQIVFGTSSSNHVAISSNNNALVINPTSSTTANQIVLYLDKASVFPSGLQGSLTGNASTATKLATKRTIALTGDVTGSGTFDGSGNLTITTTCSGGGGGEAMTVAQIRAICT